MLDWTLISITVIFLVGGGICLAAITHAGQPDIPPPSELFNRVGLTYKRLGTVSMTISRLQSVPGGGLHESVIAFDLNDWDHYVATVDHGDYFEIRVFVDGTDQTLYHPERKEWVKSQTGRFLAESGLLTGVLESIRRGRSGGDEWKAMLAATVERLSCSGRPAFELSWHTSLAAGTEPMTTRMTVVVDEESGLIQKLTSESSGGKAGVITTKETILYSFRMTAFPKETYHFTPPPGAKQVHGQSPLVSIPQTWADVHLISVNEKGQEITP